jgi:uncharacterized protein (DUF58 family)
VSSAARSEALLPAPPRLGRLTRRGTFLLAGSAVLVVAGLMLIDGVLAAMGLAGLLLLALVWLVGRANLARLTLDLDAPPRVFGGAVFPLRVTLRNPRRWIDAFQVDLEFNVAGAKDETAHARWTAAGSAADLTLRTSLPHRGEFHRHPIRFRSRSPLGLVEMYAQHRGEAPILVYPRPLTPIELQAPGVLMDAAPLEGASAGDAPGEPRGLRSYRSGDPVRRIHWSTTIRSFARGAPPVVRENDPPGFHPQHAQVLFHSFASDGELIRPDRFERALSLACGTLRHLHSLGIPATFCADFDGWREFSVSTRSQLSTCLAALAAARRARDTEVHDLQGALARVPAARTLIIISDMPADGWRRHLPSRSLEPLVIDIRHHGKRGRRHLVAAGLPS